MLAALRSAVAGPPAQIGDDVVAERRQELERQRSELRLALRAAGEQVALLEGMDTDEQSYEGVVGQQLSRLRSLDLLGDVDRGEVCPLCGRATDGEDPSVNDLRQAAGHLQRQLTSVEAIRPRRRQALEELSAQIDGLRQQLRAADEALAGLDATEPGDAGVGSRAEQQAFT
jgi:DNA repair exonuclease SbcCD ATPase subunit